MGDRMRPIPYERLMNWAREEYQERGEIFGVPVSNNISHPHIGPAAGPHTQLAQNIIAGYAAGARFFELKTVQQLDGEDLPVSKPCIFVPDEGYNVEWSTELYVPQALEEYIKAGKALAELKLGGDCQFNMSVGYDLDGIKSKKIDDFIEGLKSAGLSDSITLSTLHGCPSEEIESIAKYLICEKGLHTFVKCNPTLLGYDYARQTLDSLGFDYMQFDDHHFKADLQFKDAVPMLRRLQGLAAEHGREFGVKLTNTFPVKIAAGELPGEEMYMSGRSLYPLTLALAYRLAKEFEGRLRISFSGGADAHNVAQLYEAGIWPITMATTLLKPGGYKRLTQMAALMPQKDPPALVDVKKLQAMLDDIPNNPLYRKQIKPAPPRKLDEQAPLLDCAIAACKSGCPIEQDIPAYIKLAGEGRYLEALRLIIERNPLPHITGTICPHRCTDKCTRSFYEAPVDIRGVKLDVTEKAYEALMAESKPAPVSGAKVAIIGGGPAGLAAAYFLARAGRRVTIFEKRQSLGGTVRHIIPEFRISSEAINRDIALVLSAGVEVRTATEITSKEQLHGYESIIIATGAAIPNSLSLEEGESIQALDFLESAKKGLPFKPSQNIAVVGGGNTAMDTARAAMRMEGVKKVSIVYRSSRRQMSADEKELDLALAEGIEFYENTKPIALRKGKLICDRAEIEADLVISAIGSCADPPSWQGVHIIGDAKKGPATVAEAIADALSCVEAITGSQTTTTKISNTKPQAKKRGYLCLDMNATTEPERCLECQTICEICAEVCPNRANVVIEVEGRRQVVHMDALCNECGNCETFCPYNGAAYKDKFTYFSNQEDFNNSQNKGFYLQANKSPIFRPESPTSDAKKIAREAMLSAMLIKK